jgi:hypothetical protein
VTCGLPSADLATASATAEDFHLPALLFVAGPLLLLILSHLHRPLNPSIPACSNLDPAPFPSPVSATMSGDHGPNGAYSEVFEEGSDSRPLQTVHRIRANSTIMQLKKLLGMSSALPKLAQVQLRADPWACSVPLQWPTEERSVSLAPSPNRGPMELCVTEMLTANVAIRVRAKE